MQLVEPVHLDLPVGFRGQRNPGDLSSVVGAVNTPIDHLTALLTVATQTIINVTHTVIVIDGY